MAKPKKSDAIPTMTQAEIDALMKDAEKAGQKAVEAARGVTLAKGQAVRGTFRGSEVVNFTDKRSGEVKDFKVHTFQTAAGLARVNGAAQLDARLANVKEGTEVTVIRGLEDGEGARPGTSMGIYTVLAK